MGTGYETQEKPQSENLLPSEAALLKMYENSHQLFLKQQDQAWSFLKFNFGTYAATIAGVWAWLKGEHNLFLPVALGSCLLLSIFFYFHLKNHSYHLEIHHLGLKSIELWLNLADEKRFCAIRSREIASTKPIVLSYAYTMIFIFTGALTGSAISWFSTYLNTPLLNI